MLELLTDAFEIKRHKAKPDLKVQVISGGQGHGGSLKVYYRDVAPLLKSGRTLFPGKN